MFGVTALAMLFAGPVPVARPGITLTLQVDPREATTVNVAAPGTGLVLTLMAVRPTTMAPTKGDPNWRFERGRAVHSLAGLDLAVLGGELRDFQVDGLDLGAVRPGTVIRLPRASVLRVGPGWARVEHAPQLWTYVEVVMRVESGPPPLAALVEDATSVRAVAQGTDGFKAFEVASAALVAHLAGRSPRARAVIDAAALASTGKTTATVELQLALLRR